MMNMLITLSNHFTVGFLSSSVVKQQQQQQKTCLPMQEMWVQSLGWKDALEKEMETHSSILSWRIPMDRGAWRAIVHGVTKSWT